MIDPHDEVTLALLDLGLAIAIAVIIAVPLMVWLG
jgi:hypothetical protein